MEDELEALYRRFAFTVHRRCVSLLGDPDEAYEVTHDVFLKVIEMGDAKIHTPSSLLYVIATRLCLDRLRQRASRRTSTDTDLLDRIVGDGPSPEEMTGARRLLQRLFGGVDEDARVAAILHHVDGLTLEETALELQTSVSTVRRRLRTLKLDLAQLEGT